MAHPVGLIGLSRSIGFWIEGRALTLARRLSGWLPAAMLLFVAAAFALPKEPAYALVFYVAVLPCLLARLAEGSWRFRADAAQLLALGLVVWSGLTLLWGTDDGHRAWRFAGDTAATFAFLLAMLLTLPDPAMRRRLAMVLVVAGALNACFAIAVFLVTHPIFPRLRGWGATSHVILGAAVMATAALSALARGLAPVVPRRERVLHLAAFASMAVFILMTESRGPLLAACVGVLVLCVASVWRVRAFGGMAVLAAIWFSLPQAARHHGEAVLVERGSSHRFEVWRYTLGLIRERPLLGHGLAANLHLDVGDRITFPHDLYLSLLFYSGAVGLVLFVAMAALLTWHLLRWRWRDPEWAWLVALWANLLVTGLTDLGQITKGPGPLWFIVWLPLGLLLTVEGRKHFFLEKEAKTSANLGARQMSGSAL
jgi:O-antigen ligase